MLGEVVTRPNGYRNKFSAKFMKTATNTKTPVFNQHETVKTASLLINRAGSSASFAEIGKGTIGKVVHVYKAPGKLPIGYEVDFLSERSGQHVVVTCRPDELAKVQVAKSKRPGSIFRKSILSVRQLLEEWIGYSPLEDWYQLAQKQERLLKREAYAKYLDVLKRVAAHYAPREKLSPADLCIVSADAVCRCRALLVVAGKARL